jgi:transglutaminase-like putative cysteine protease
VSARSLVLLALAVGALALALCPGPHRLVGLTQLALVAAAAVWGPRPSERWALAHGTFLISLAILVAARLPLALVASLVLGWLSIHRAWTATTPRALQVGLLLAVLEGVLCTRLGRPAGLGALFGVLMVLGPLALARIQQRGRGPLLLAAAIGLASLALGALAPRPTNPQPPSARAVGFSRDIALGDLGPLHDDPTFLAQITADVPLSDELYLRGVILDRFTGGGWISSAPEQALPPRDLSAVSAITHEVTLAPLTGGVLLGPPQLVGVTGQGGLEVWRDLFGTWRHTGPLRAVRYAAHSSHEPLAEPLLGSGRWLGLPADLDPRIRSLAARLKADAPDGRAAQVEATVRWLRENYTYTRLPEPETERQALSVFLFDSRQGHCEYFATALAVLLRAQGVEARVVTGVRGGEAVEGGRLMRQSDAHAWVEVHDPERGWVGVDATPPALREPPELPQVRSAALLSGTQRQALSWTELALALAGLVAGGVAWRRRRQADPLVRRYQQARRLVARRGYTIPDALPPVAAGDWLVAHAGDAGRPLVVLAALLYRHRYGGAPVDEVEAEAHAALRLLRRLPRRS